MFISDQINKQGIYGVILYTNGEKQLVLVDDYVPIGENGLPCFAQSGTNELWVILFEKAWAKVNGCYERIQGGMAQKVFRDLTGAPAFDHPTEDPDLFQKLLEGSNRKFAMAAGIEPKTPIEEAYFRQMGLGTQHAYSILKAVEVTDESGKKVELLKIRNPWGIVEWKGDWSSHSK